MDAKKKVVLHANSESALRESRTRIRNLWRVENENPSQVAVTTSEEKRKILEATEFVSSDQLGVLDNFEIALLLYFLVFNGTDKNFLDFYDIGNQFGVIAANLNGR